MTASRRSVAVVAVHGVSDQRPGATARSIADALHLHGGGAYAPTGERAVSVRVDDWRGAPPGAPSVATSQPSWWQRSRWSTDIEFSHRLLGEGKAPARADRSVDTYATSAIDLRTDGGETVGVHELYWADLSRVESGPIQLLVETYQILLHLPTLARHVVRSRTSSVGHGSESRMHRAFRGVVDATSNVIQGPIPALSVVLLCLSLAGLLVSLVGQLSPDLRWTAAVAAVLSISAAVVSWAVVAPLREAKAELAGLAAAAVTFAWLAGAGLVGHAMAGGQSTWIEAMILAGSCLLALAPAAAVALAYEPRRPSSGRWFAVIGAAAVLLIGLRLWAQPAERWTPPDPNGLPMAGALLHALLDVGSCLAIGVVACWSLVYVLTVGVVVLGLALLVGTHRHDVPRRSVWSAVLLLVIPSSLFALVTIAMWSVVDAVVQMQQLRLPEGLHSFWLPGIAPQPAHLTFRAFVHQLLVDVAGTGFPLLLGGCTVGVALAVLLIGPFPLLDLAGRLDPGGDRSRRVGRQLTRAHLALTGPGVVLLIGWFVGAGITGLGYLRPDLAIVTETTRVLGGWATDPLLTHSTALWASSTSVVALLVALRARLDLVAGGFRSVLDVAFDVDNHLREHPIGENPRAAIFRRYRALLEHLLDRYDAIVFVAHSQGTVITADLLRFLAATESSFFVRGNREAHVSLLTVGCPLRQLYGRRFPDLYAWAMQASGPDIPKPLARWVNLHTSGDYVGRTLWGEEADETTWTPGAINDLGDRQEACIGTGGHTGYWSGAVRATAPWLAALVDEAREGNWVRPVVPTTDEAA